MHNKNFKHPFEPENRYNLVLEIHISESNQEFFLKLKVGYGLPIPIMIQKENFLFTHHHSLKKSSEPFSSLKISLNQVENKIKEEFKDNFFLTNCSICVDFESRASLRIHVAEMTSEQVLAIFLSFKEQILQATVIPEPEMTCCLF